MGGLICAFRSGRTDLEDVESEGKVRDETSGVACFTAEENVQEKGRVRNHACFQSEQCS